MFIVERRKFLSLRTSFTSLALKRRRNYTAAKLHDIIHLAPETLTTQHENSSFVKYFKVLRHRPLKLIRN